MKKLTILAGLITVAALLGGCGSEAAQESSAQTKLDTLRLAYMTGGFDQYTALIGLEQGIFEKYGINLETTEYVAGIKTVDAVANGTADVGMMANYATVNRFGNTWRETNLIIISQLGASESKEASNNGLYVAPEYVDNLQALDGSTGFVAQIGTFNEYVTSLAIEHIGLEESRQNIVATDSNQTTLAIVQNGEATAVYAGASLGERLEEYGWKLAVPLEDLEVINGSFFITTSEFNEENTELLARFLQAVQESFDYIQAHLDETGEYLSAATGVEKADFVANWSSMVSELGFSEEGAQDLEAMEEWCYQHGNFSEEFAIRDFINVDAARLAFPERVSVELE